MISRSNRRAFTLIEVLIACIMLSLAILSMLWTVNSSNKGAMDAYYEFMGMCLAREPIEVFRGFGYDWTSQYANHPLSDFPLGSAQISNKNLAGVQRPVEATAFSRSIAISPPILDGDNKGVRVTVKVAPAGQSRVMAWLSRKEITLEAMIMERPR